MANLRKFVFLKKHRINEHVCPYCGADAKKTGIGEPDATGCQGQVSRGGHCYACGGTWLDVYVLSNTIAEDQDGYLGN